MKTVIVTLILMVIGVKTEAALLPGQWGTGRLGEIEYLAYYPKSAETLGAAAGSRAPAGLNRMMVNLHGCAQKAEDLKTSGNWEAAAERFRMLVVLPKVPNGGVIFGCWDYYGRNHTTSNRHNGALIALTEALVNDPSLRIDKREVYVSGLSSGGGEAFVLGCLRPDLFAGVGLASSPILGSESSEIQRPSISSDEASKLCASLAGSFAGHLKSQIASIIVGDQDPIVNTVHSRLSAEALSKLYGATKKIPLDRSELTGANTEGSGTYLVDSGGTKLISFLVNNGLGHAWAAGNADAAKQMWQAGNFINGNSVDYPMYLGKFLSENNLRTH